MPTNAGKSGSIFLGEFRGGRLGGVSGTLGFPLERRVSLMLVTMLISAVVVDRTLLRRLLGGWAFALAFRREVFASLDVCYTAATSLPPSGRCRVTGALLDELLLVTRLAPLLETNLRAEPAKHSTRRTHLQVALAAASRPSQGRTGSLCTVWSRREEEHVRLDWKGEEPTEQHARRTCSGCAACSEVEVDHVVFLPFLRKHAYPSTRTREPGEPPL